MNLQTVHIRVNDAATGQPTPVRLRVTDSAGSYYAPFGHAAEFPVGRGETVGGDVMIGHERWAYIDGTCETALPAGELTVEVQKGPEYRPLRQVVNLPAGKLALRFAIERETNLRQSGWFSGDTRAHFLSPHAALLEAAAEDLAVVHLLAREMRLLASDGQAYMTYPNLPAFSGQQPCLERDGTAVAVGTLNAHPVLGKLALLHSHRVVYPVTFGGADASDDWSLADWCGQCHRKRGLVIWADAFDSKVAHAGEGLADLILGDIDALELDDNSPQRLRAWYQLLNAGIHVPVVGASGKDSSRLPIGALRTYARLEPGQPFGLADWIEALRAGRTVVTSGPFVSLDVEGIGIGQTLRRNAGQSRITARMETTTAGERLELLVNGGVIATVIEAEYEHTFDLPGGGWVAARMLRGGRFLAHTSPVYVEVEGAEAPIDPAAVQFLDGHLQRTREWIVAEGRFTLPKSRDHLLGIIDNAREKLLARAGRSGTISP
jgi:hypothetical protein